MIVLDYSSTKMNRESISGLQFSYNCIALGHQNGSKINRRGTKNVVVLVKMDHQDPPRGRKSVVVLVKMGHQDPHRGRKSVVGLHLS